VTADQASLPDTINTPRSSIAIPEEMLIDLLDSFALR
jgi:hypothetical protein